MKSAALLVLTLVLAGCVGAPSTTDQSRPSGVSDATLTPQSRHTDSGSGSPEVLDLAPYNPEEFWLHVAPGGLAVFEYTSFEEMVSAADLIVLGRAGRVTEGRPLPAEAGAEGYGRGQIQFSVESVVTGDAVMTGPDTIMIEFVLGDERLLPKFTAEVPTERVLLFLGNNGKLAEELGYDGDGPLGGYEYYGIQSPQGYLREVNGRAQAPIGSDEDWLTALQGRTLDAIAESISPAASSS